VTRLESGSADGPAPPTHAFIVGVSRSGTTLMRHVLNRHSAIAIAPENHFLGHLLPHQGVVHRIRRMGALSDEGVVGRVVEYLYGDLQKSARWREPSRFWTWLQRHVDADELKARFLSGERSERGLFDLLLGMYAERRGKVVAGEKTPGHLRHVDTLLAWYPGARVIHMMRDPRGIYASELRRRRQHAGALPYRLLAKAPPLLAGVILLQTTAAWMEGSVRSTTYARRFPRRYRIVRFEDLVREPHRTIAGVCEFLGLPFEPSMLEQHVVSAGAHLGQAGFDAAAADRWRSATPRWVNVWFTLLLRRSMARQGYMGTSTGTPPG
jgi:hypothetical protein